MDGSAVALEAQRKLLLPPYHQHSANPEGVYLVSEMIDKDVSELHQHMP